MNRKFLIGISLKQQKRVAFDDSNWVCVMEQKDDVRHRLMNEKLYNIRRGYFAVISIESTRVAHAVWN